MKIFFIIALNCFLILGIFLFEHQKSKDLIRQVDKLENSIESKKSLQLAIENFKLQQSQVLLQNKNVIEMEAPKYQTFDFLVGLANGLPSGISLVELTTSEDGTFIASGRTKSEAALDSFVNLRHLTLLESKRNSFKVSGKI